MNELVDELLDYLKKKGIIWNQSQFEKRCGFNNSIITNIKSGKRKLSRHYALQICNAFPFVNINWLLTGNGEMIIDNNISKIKYFPNFDGTMHQTEFVENPNEDFVYITLPGYSNNCMAINAYGDSMYPLIKSGEIIIVTKWDESFIDWGKIYLIITKSGYRAIKRLLPSKKKDFVLCKSENEAANPPFEVQKEDITRMYLVKGWICKEVI